MKYNPIGFYRVFYRPDPIEFKKVGFSHPWITRSRTSYRYHRPESSVGGRAARYPILTCLKSSTCFDSWLLQLSILDASSRFQMHVSTATRRTAT